MNKIIENLYQLILKLQKLVNSMETSPQKLYRIAKDNLGKDVSPTQNEVGCVESLETIHRLAFGDYISGTANPLLSTIELKKALIKRQDFVRIDNYEVGAIILCVTGESQARSNGHAGICGKFQIMSNNSRNSLWEANYTLASWKKYYEGFPIYFYRKL